MTITVNIKDDQGNVAQTLNFPDGTDPQVIQAKVKELTKTNVSSPLNLDAPQPFVDPRQAAIEGGTSIAGTIGTNIAAGFSGLTRAVPEVFKAGRDAVADAVGLGNVVDFAAKTDVGQAAGLSPPDINAPVEAVREVQAAGAEVFGPESAAAKKGVETVTKAVEAVAKPIKFGLSAVPRVIGGKEEQEKFLEIPIGDYLGELAQDNGASPLLSTIAHVSPDLALAGLGGAGASRAGRAANAPVPAPIPTVAQLKEQAAALYKVVDDSGITISNASATRAVNAIEQAMQKRGIRKKLTPDTRTALDEIIKDAKAGDITLAKSEELRQVINQAKGALKPADAAAAQKLGDLWDDFIETLKPSDIAGPGAANVDQVKQYLLSARNLWSRARKSDEVQELLRKAEINVQSQQGNISLSQAIRTQFRQLATNSRRLKRFTPEERQFITRVATGDSLERAARTLGKFAPNQTMTGLGELALAGGAIVSGNPALIAGAVMLPITAGLAKRLSSVRTEKFARQASEAVRRGPN